MVPRKPPQKPKPPPATPTTPAKGDATTMRFDVYLHNDELTNNRLDQILAELKHLRKEGTKVSQELDELTASVTNNTSVTDSAVELLNGLGAKIQELSEQVAAGGGDPAALQALAAELNTNASELAAAVAANTPASTNPDDVPHVEHH